MTGPNSIDSDDDAQAPQVPAASSSGTAMEAGEIHGLPERVMNLDENTDSISNPEPLALVNAPPEEPPPPILYKVDYYYGEENRFAFSKKSKEPMAVQNTLSILKKAVIEVITDVRIIGPYTPSIANEEKPRITISILRTSLKINSPAIIAALQSVIEYYPGRSFSEDSNVVEEPFMSLIHHEEELKAYRDRFHPSKIDSKIECCQRNENTYEHLGILQSILFERSGKEVEAERQRHARGVATFEMLWLLFKPGTDVYSDFAGDGNYDAYVVKSLSGGVFGGRPSSLTIHLWNMNYDGHMIGRKAAVTELPVYDGEKDITSLGAFPCKFWKEKSEEGEDSRPLKQKLEERGKMFFRLTQRQCMDYEGLRQVWPKKHVSVSRHGAMFLRVSDLSERQFKGLTMLDTEVYYAEEKPNRRPLLGKIDDTSAYGVSECLCHVCLRSKKSGVRRKISRYSSYDDIYMEVTKSLTDHQYFLCPPSVYAYVFKTREWGKSLLVDGWLL